MRWIAVAAAVGGLVTGGCGGDGGGGGDDRAGESGPEEASGETAETEATTAPVEPDLVAYCDAELAFETAPAPGIDAAATPEQEAADLRAYGAETLGPLADALVDAAPEPVADDVARLDAAVDELAASGDYGVLGHPDVEAARDALHAFDVESCGWRTKRVTTTESSFGGMPNDLDAGPISFELVNEGQNLHELVLVRKNDGVTASVEELLSMPEEESRRLVTEIGTAYAAQGEQDYLVADLEPGEYIGACFLPSGMTSEDGPPPQNPPHVALGMVLGFTVR